MNICDQKKRKKKEKKMSDECDLYDNVQVNFMKK
jgi:hypothetical protein